MLDAINEGSLSVTSMTRIRDVLNPTDVAIYRALAGGVTAANLLHGSANSIGGQNASVKFKWGKPVEDFPIPDAPPGIKFAMGENVRRRTDGRHSAAGQPPRYPRTRRERSRSSATLSCAHAIIKKAWDDYQGGEDDKIAAAHAISSSSRLSRCSKANVLFTLTAIVRTSI